MFEALSKFQQFEDNIHQNDGVVDQSTDMAADDMCSDHK